MNDQEIRAIFTKRFGEAVKTSGKSCKQLADYLGVNKSTVSMYLHGKAVPSMETLYFISEFLDVSSDYLIGRSDI